MNFKNSTLIVVGLFLILLLSLISLSIGSVTLSLPEVVSALSRRDPLTNHAQILLYVRLPRTFAAILAGAALAVSGTILQTVFNNPIVSPNIIGVNAGSGLFSLMAMIFFPTSFFLTPLFAFIGAMLAGMSVYWLGYKTGASKTTIVLSGVAVTGILSAFSDALITLFPEAQIGRTYFMIGGLNAVTMKNVLFSLVYIAVALIFASIFSNHLNILALGDETASSLGLKTNQIRFLYIVIASLLAASAVSLTGLIGFVGLMVPHISRFFVGYDNRISIPLSGILGASFLLICDMMARTLFAPFEIPVGIVLSFIGTPFFIYLLYKKKGVQHD